MIYMGRDKYESEGPALQRMDSRSTLPVDEELIKHGWDEDVW